MKQLIRKLIAPIYWRIINRRKGCNVEEYGTYFNLRIGKGCFIRKGSEVGYRVELGDYSYISGPGSYVEDAVIGKYCSIARQVTIGVSGHNYNWVTTSPIIVSREYGFV